MIARTLAALLLVGLLSTSNWGCATVDTYIAEGDLDGAYWFCVKEGGYGDAPVDCCRKVASLYEEQGLPMEALKAYRSSSDEINVTRTAKIEGEKKLLAGDYNEAEHLLIEGGLSSSEVSIKIAEHALSQGNFSLAYAHFTSLRIPTDDYCPKMAKQLVESKSNREHMRYGYTECSRHIAVELFKADELDEAALVYEAHVAYGGGRTYGRKPSTEDATFSLTLAKGFMNKADCRTASEYYGYAGIPVADYAEDVAVCYGSIGDFSAVRNIIYQAGLTKGDVMIKSGIALEAKKKYLKAGVIYLAGEDRARAAGAFIKALDDDDAANRHSALLYLWKEIGRKETVKALSKVAYDKDSRVSSTAALLFKLAKKRALSTAVVDMGTVTGSAGLDPNVLSQDMIEMIRGANIFTAKTLMTAIDRAVGKGKLAPFKRYIKAGKLKIKKKYSRPLTTRQYYGETDYTLEQIDDIVESRDYDVIVAYYTAIRGERRMKVVRNYAVIIPGLSERKWLHYGCDVMSSDKSSKTSAKAEISSDEATDSYRIFREETDRYLKQILK